MIDGIRHIRGFLAVARLGSFTRAAIELHVSQPALTVQIQQLENTLGVTLLDRNKRKVAVTQAGQDLLAPLERILMDVESIVNTGHDLAELRRGVVTVAVVPSLAATLMPLALCDFCQSYPGVSVRLKDSVGNLIEMVKSGEVDFGVGGETQRDRAIVTQDLFTEPICVFAPKNHPLANKQVVTLDELVEHPAILPQKHSSLRAILENALEAQKLSIRPLHETSHISTTIGMVNAGLGIAILPLRAIDCFLAKDIRCIAIKPALERRVVIVSRAGRSFSPAVERLIEILHQIAPKLPRQLRVVARRAR
jgi:LysR family transcriptional regulator, carnitine catabolism transcriptional activator